MSLAKNFDIFATAGGARKVTSITGTVEHEDDAITGADEDFLCGEQGQAKFNTVEIKDASGASVIVVQRFGTGGRFFSRRRAHAGNQRTADLARPVAAVEERARMI